MEVIELDFTIKKSVENAIDKICRTISTNGVCVIPTDTLYGISARICEETIGRIFEIKRRPAGKPIPILVDSFEMLRKVAIFDSRIEELMRKLWPGPISVILPKADGIPDSLTANTRKIMVRIPDNSFLVEIIRRIDAPITSTSANISGSGEVLDGSLLIKEFEEVSQRPDLVVDGGVLRSGLPSTILDLSSGNPRIVRFGAYPKEKVECVLGSERL
jgi:L-threonylcarbamoyladenylate synthase